MTTQSTKLTELTELTFTDRYKNATKELKKAGIKAYRNIQGCCRSCIGSDKFDNPTEPIIWHYGGQGNRIEFGGNFVYYSKTSDYVDSFYLNHANITPELATTILDIFADNGIVVEWDKSLSLCIEVKPMLSVPHRTEEEQAHLVNDLLTKHKLTYDEAFEWSYRKRQVFSKLWSLEYLESTLDDLLAQESKQRHLDKLRAIAADTERAYRAEQQRLQDLVVDNLPESLSTNTRFLMWLDTAKPVLKESDTVDKGIRLAILEQSLFEGQYEDSEAFAKLHYAKDYAKLPKWVTDEISWFSVSSSLKKDFVYKSQSWGLSTFVWKKENS
jgi:hypothetical protein